MVVREVLDNGLCLLTESMPDVRSVSLGAWLTRGSRHEGPEHEGIAHLVEHMLFKGTTTRTTSDIAQDVDILSQARNAAFDLIERDPHLRAPEHAELRAHFIRTAPQSLGFARVG